MPDQALLAKKVQLECDGMVTDTPALDPGVEGDPLHVIVRRERERRALNASSAAQAGGVSHTLWRDYESGKKLTPKMQLAVSRTFGWPLSWPERPPTPEAPMDRLDEMKAEVDKIVILLRDLLLAVQALVDSGQR